MDQDLRLPYRVGVRLHRIAALLERLSGEIATLQGEREREAQMLVRARLIARRVPKNRKKKIARKTGKRHWHVRAGELLNEPAWVRAAVKGDGRPIG